jgi:hypothetical protein
VRRLLAVLVLACGWAGAAPAGRAQAPAPCSAEVSVEPSRAYVGQQVVYRVRMLRHESVREVRWLRALSFPSLRAEWLPGRMPDPRITGIGDARLVSEDRRALFPVRAGVIEIPPASVGCRLADGEELEIPVPGTRLEALPLPEAGRPAGFSGVVGPVQVRAHLSRRWLELGETTALAVIVVGEANVWAAEAPLDPAQPGLDVYPRTPELLLEPGERLRARRSFVWTLVPRRTGLIELPPARVPWFDPASGAFVVASAPPLLLEVRPAAATADVTPPPPPAEPDARAPRRGVLLAALALLAGLAAGAAAWRHRRGAPLRAAAPALADAEQALAVGDRAAAAAALAAALRAGLAQRLPGAGTLATEELVRRTHGQAALAEAAELLAALDRARFAAVGAAAPLPALERVRAVLRALGPARRI